MADLWPIFRAGRTYRWHANADLCDSVDPVDGHAARVARIILALHPAPSIDLITAALTHDDGEQGVGDMTGPAKRDNLVLAEALARAERRARRALWHGDPAALETSLDQLWLDFADGLDAYMWAAWHRPAVLERGDWRAMRRWLEETALSLGVSPWFDGLEVPR